MCRKKLYEPPLTDKVESPLVRQSLLLEFSADGYVDDLPDGTGSDPGSGSLELWEDGGRV